MEPWTWVKENWALIVAVLVAVAAFTRWLKNSYQVRLSRLQIRKLKRETDQRGDNKRTRWSPKIFSGDRTASLPRRLNRLSREAREDLATLAEHFPEPRRLSRLYVAPDAQKSNPADGGPPEDRRPVMDHLAEFFHRDSPQSDGANQLFLVGDSGMGKSSLLLILKLYNMTATWRAMPHKHCYLRKFREVDVRHLRELHEPQDSLLLLDGVDEVPGIIAEFEEIVAPVLAAASKFQHVILTSRTQYFPKRIRDSWKRTGYQQIAGFSCPLLFLPLLSDEHTKRYLRRLFPPSALDRLRLRPHQDFSRSLEVLRKASRLRFRPMLLEHIKYFFDSDIEIWTEFSVYSALVWTWLNREAVRIQRNLNAEAATTGIGSMSHGLETVNRAVLFQACVLLAHRLEGPNETIDDTELEHFSTFHPAMTYVQNFDFGNRCLLTRTSAGQYRFSHDSVREFLLVHSLATEFDEVSRDWPSTHISPTPSMLGFFDGLINSGFIERDHGSVWSPQPVTRWYGNYLKGKRVSRSISLADLVAETRIPLEWFEALENGNFADLRSPFYAKAYAEQYARFIGLEETVVRRWIGVLYEFVIAVARTRAPSV